jgi:hypothetical protein
MLLNLNMPGLDGREPLLGIKADHRNKSIRGSVLPRARLRKKNRFTDDASAALNATKPVIFPARIDVVRTLGVYRFAENETPGNQERGNDG